MLLRNNIYEMIRRSIMTGGLRPGQALREHELADQYHVSRSPIRDALLRLEQEFLVTVLPRQGYVINALTSRDCWELQTLCAILQPACADLAARGGNEAVASLDEVRPDRAAPLFAQDMLAYESLFQTAVARLSGNLRLATMACSVIDQINRLRLLDEAQGRRFQQNVRKETYDAIIDAIQEHDGSRACELVSEHLARTAITDEPAADSALSTARIHDG